MIPALPAYLLSAGLGLAGAAGILSAVAAQTVPLLGTQVPLAYLLPPIVGLALFQLVFGTCTGRWRGWRFWMSRNGRSGCFPPVMPVRSVVTV